ncbi:MAG TPA: protein-methionine-sulfoxide reductase heme-binding subunit MsrQ [Terriglobia bacterium]|jgi:methionine sulfoxide reductase heme-binding subunit|nr:protein-methionine-sulfoxide reductase heme-binding subunit MsrQ [Terriglobia bacterium]
MLKPQKVLKVCVFLTCLTPLFLLLTAAAMGNLSANPIKDITEDTGAWTLRFLLITLSMTPLRKLAGWNAVIKFRRMVGLFAFFYGFLHLTTYLWLDQFFSIPDIMHDVLKRPFITAGAAGFALMVPLAVTSTRKWISRIGGKRWQLLHRLVYVSAFAGVVHYVWLVKADIQRPVTYGVLLAILMAYRLFVALRSRVAPQRLESGAMLSYSQTHD